MSGSITLLTNGTRGDVQPLVGLGRGLRDAGAAVTLAAPAGFASFVAPGGLPFRGFEGNPSDLLGDTAARAALNDSGDFLDTLRASWRFWRAAQPVYRRMLGSALDACRGATALGLGLSTVWGVHVADALGARVVWLPLQPLTKTRHAPSALLPVRRGPVRAFAPLTHDLVNAAMTLPWARVTNAWRREVGLPALPITRLAGRVCERSALVVYGISPQVVTRPSDWPASHHLAGFWFWEPEPDWQPPLALADFLAQGRALAVSFGTAALRDPQRTLRALAEAMRATGLRAVVQLPEALHGAVAGHPALCAIAGAPHAWLFERVEAVVHHAGAGTTAHALRAGKPALVIPHATDQPFWGERLEALGVGSVLAFRDLTPERLAAALTVLRDDAALRARAEALGARVRSESGVAQAIALLAPAL